MILRTGGHVFSGPRLPFGLAIAVVVAAGLMSGCASSAVEPAVAGVRGPVNTGTFPNLNIPPAQAAAQLTPSETSAHVAALQTAAQQHEASIAIPSGQTDPALLRKLAQSHAGEALKEIGQ